jgi:hypothetical protein
VLLWLGDGNPNTIDHVVTGAYYRINHGTGQRWIGIADPWTHHANHDEGDPGGPDHNNAPVHTYEEFLVLNLQPLIIDYPNGNLQMVMKLIFISPGPPSGDH